MIIMRNHYSLTINFIVALIVVGISISFHHNYAHNRFIFYFKFLAAIIIIHKGYKKKITTDTQFLIINYKTCTNS